MQILHRSQCKHPSFRRQRPPTNLWISCGQPHCRVRATGSWVITGISPATEARSAPAALLNFKSRAQIAPDKLPGRGLAVSSGRSGAVATVPMPAALLEFEFPECGTDCGAD